MTNGKGRNRGLVLHEMLNPGTFPIVITENVLQRSLNVEGILGLECKIGFSGKIHKMLEMLVMDPFTDSDGFTRKYQNLLLEKNKIALRSRELQPVCKIKTY